MPLLAKVRLVVFSLGLLFALAECGSAESCRVDRSLLKGAPASVGCLAAAIEARCNSEDACVSRCMESSLGRRDGGPSTGCFAHCYVLSEPMSPNQCRCMADLEAIQGLTREDPLLAAKRAYALASAGGGEARMRSLEIAQVWRARPSKSDFAVEVPGGTGNDDVPTVGALISGVNCGDPHPAAVQRARDWVRTFNQGLLELRASAPSLEKR